MLRQWRGYTEINQCHMFCKSTAGYECIIFSSFINRLTLIHAGEKGNSLV